MSKLCVLVLAVMTLWRDCASGYSEFYKQHKRGWHWFEDARNNEDEKFESHAKSDAKSAVEELKDFQEKFEEAKAKLVMQPSLEHAKEFAKYSKQMYDKAGQVSEYMKQAMLRFPEYNPALNIPISDTGVKVRRKQSTKQQKSSIENFISKFTMVFVKSKKSIYANDFIQVLKSFARKYPKSRIIEVDESSPMAEQFTRIFGARSGALDGGLPTCALYAYSRELKIALPLGYNFLSINELEENIAFAANTIAKQDKLKESNNE